jgi:putative hydrolase of the HAD superfamily
MAGFAAAHGACYAPDELKAAYLRAVGEAEAALRRRDREIPGACPEIDLGPVFARLYGEKGAAADAALIRETALLFRRASTTHLRLYAGARELLASLRKRGKVILLSNAQSLFTRPELDELGLTDCFDGIYLSSEAGVKKPDPRFFRLALEQEGLDPGRCLMIGNDPICDGQGARAAGMDAWVIRSALSPGECPEGYDQQGMDLRKLSEILT